jgi:hypothetical protein
MKALICALAMLAVLSAPALACKRSDLEKEQQKAQAAQKESVVETDAQATVDAEAEVTETASETIPAEEAGEE